MSTNPSIRRGGKSRKYVQAPDGRDIIGLSLHKKSRRYYAIAPDGKRIYFGRDLSEAAFRFHRWQGGILGDVAITRTLPLSALQDLNQTPKDAKRLDYHDGRYPTTPIAITPELIAKLKAETGRTESELQFDLTPVDEWLRIRKMLLEDAETFQQKIGLRIRILDKPQDPITFDKLWAMYEASPRVSQSRKDEGKKVWEAFQAAIGVNSIDAISADKIRAYRDGMLGTSHNPSYIQKRFKLVKAILNNGAKEGIGDEDLTRIIGLSKMLRLPDTSSVNGSDPKPIAPEDFKALLAVATDPMDRAILLIGLNCSYYPVDVSRLPLSAVNLKKRIVNFRRQKTGGTTRVAWLWDETIDAIKAYQEAYPHQAETLFVSSHGKPLSTATIVAHFNALRDAANLPTSITFSCLRDGCTPAQRAGVSGELIDVQLGHRLPGQRDKYIKRSPEDVRPVADAMHAHYFAETEKEAPKETDK